MSNRYEVKFPVKSRDGKTYWNRCGVAFKDKDGDGFTIILESIPVPIEAGPIKIKMWPPQDKAAKGGETVRGDLNDEIPF